MPRPKKGEEHPLPGMGDRIGMLAAIGTTNDHIARICNMSTATLHKHYQDDLDLGASKAGAVVGGKIFEAAKRGEQWACTLWAVRRLGWKETNVHQHSGPNGGPIATVIDAAGLSTSAMEELLAARRIDSDSEAQPE